MAVFYITQVKLIFNKQMYKANFISFSTIHWHMYLMMKVTNCEVLRIVNSQNVAVPSVSHQNCGLDTGTTELKMVPHHHCNLFSHKKLLLVFAQHNCIQ